jgi:hypothetical protein
MVPASPYVPGTYGRAYPMATVYLGESNALQGFVHVNPDGSGTTYLRIAQAQITDWFNPVTNITGGSGVNMRQQFVVLRGSNEPDFWGNRDVTYDPGDPANGVLGSFVASARDTAHDGRLANVQLFRFGLDLSTDTTERTMIVDAPIAGQQTSNQGRRYISYYTSPSDIVGGAQFYFDNGNAGVVSGAIHVIPAPGALGVGVCLLFAARRRRAPLGQLSLT